MNKNKYFSVFLSYLLILCFAVSLCSSAFAVDIDADSTAENQTLGDITVIAAGDAAGLNVRAEK